MDAWLDAVRGGLSTAELRELEVRGFVVVPGPVRPAGLGQLARAYDSAVVAADSEDVSIGRTTTRVHDFVNRGPEFDELYVHKPALEACCHVLGRPFKLSTMLARTLRPHSPAQDLHVDVKRDADGWSMLGFVFMVDDFEPTTGQLDSCQARTSGSTVPTISRTTGRLVERARSSHVVPRGP